jgi:hypothetical protein
MTIFRQDVGAAQTPVELSSFADRRAEKGHLSRSASSSVPMHQSRSGLYWVFPLLRRIFKMFFFAQVDEERNSIIQTQTIVSLSKVITAKAMQQCLMFIYTGSIDQEYLQLEVNYY